MAQTETVSQDVPVYTRWWLVLLEGIAAIILGLMFLASPGSTTVLLVQIVGWFWLISGIFSLVNMFIDHHQWGWKLLAGIIGVIAGFVIIQHPLWSAFLVPASFLIVLAIGGIIIGISKLIQAFSGEGWGAGVLGVLSILFGLLILAEPLIGVVAFLAAFPVIAIVGGIVAIVAAFRLRGVEREIGREEVQTFQPAVSAVPVTGEQVEESEQHVTDVQPPESELHEYDEGTTESEPHQPDEPTDRTTDQPS